MKPKNKSRLICLILWLPLSFLIAFSFERLHLTGIALELGLFATFVGTIVLAIVSYNVVAWFIEGGNY